MLLRKQHVLPALPWKTTVPSCNSFQLSKHLLSLHMTARLRRNTRTSYPRQQALQSNSISSDLSILMFLRLLHHFSHRFHIIMAKCKASGIQALSGMANHTSPTTPKA